MSDPRHTTEWTSERIVETYLDFFRSRGHVELPSSSLVPENDPTVLLTTAGMQQMIPYMLGRAEPPAKRLSSVQKCFRTTDIDSVGDRAHLTFFEMLGNFSIGDYFKSEMILMAWELVTQGFDIPPDRVWVTVHPSDDEAPELWRSVGLPPNRIVDDESNFWGPPGASGPCGPDTEIYVDRGPAFGCGRDDCRGPLCDCERYLEIWNLVFMEYFQDTDGKRSPLAQPNIDTGAGLERIASVLQDTPSVYETDLFLPIMNKAGEMAGKQYGADEATDYALRVLADHGRAMVFLVGDGVQPGNEGRGYVLRRVIRRAVRYGQRLGLDRPFLADLAEIVINRMSGRHPTLRATGDQIQQILSTEESRFLSTLQAGLNLLDRLIDDARRAGAQQLGGQQIFRLYDTYGFPRELSEEIVAEAGLKIGWEEYERAMAAQRERSRGAARFEIKRDVGQASQVTAQPPTVFLGYTRTTAPSQVLAVQRDGADAARLAPGEQGTIVLAESPFYAESGGQVGDTGEIVTPDGRFVVEDTQRDGAGHFLHIGRVERGEFGAGQPVEASVDVQRRADVMRHHSATHLLHKSLQVALGPQARQAGSLVAPHVARFDFPHEGPVRLEKLEEIEDLIGRQILADVPVVVDEMHFQAAIDRGAMAMFGEKYGDRVRVVSIDDFSRELCGGTHVARTGELGAAYIVGESGIGSGMRRVELVAGRAAYDYARACNRQIASLAERLSSSPDRLGESVDGLLAELREARRRASRLEAELAQAQSGSMLERVQHIEGIPLLAARVQVDSGDALGTVVDTIRRQLGSGVIVLGAVIEGSPQFVASVSKDLIGPGLEAGPIVKQVAAVTGGGGGGRPEFARAGGRPELADKLDEALASAAALIRKGAGAERP
jgi:alanyl-tRNA synthetase